MVSERGSLALAKEGGLTTVLKGTWPRAVREVLDGAGQLLVPAEQQYFEETDDGWVTSQHVTPFVAAKDRVDRRRWPSPRMSEWSDLRSATADGTTLVAGTDHVDGSGFQVRAQVSRDQRWSTSGGLGRHPFEELIDLEHVGDRFVMAVRTRTDTDATIYRGRIYESVDGTSWTEPDATRTADRAASSYIGSICELPDGRALAVGQTQQDRNSAWTATSWVRDGGSWQMTPLQDIGNGATFTGCSRTEGSTVITGTRNGVTQYWQTTDGTTMTPVQTLAPGEHRDAPHPVEGGVVAGGSVTTSDYSGPVVWFSTDGKSWQWVPVGGDDALATVTVSRAGKDVYAASTSSRGNRVWRIEKISSTEIHGD